MMLDFISIYIVASFWHDKDIMLTWMDCMQQQTAWTHPCHAIPTERLKLNNCVHTYARTNNGSNAP